MAGRKYLSAAQFAHSLLRLDGRQLIDGDAAQALLAAGAVRLHEREMLWAVPVDLAATVSVVLEE